MNVALFAHRTAWPPFKGSQVRSFNILKALAAHGHDVHFFAFTDDEPQSVRRGLSQYATSVTLAPLGQRANLRAAFALLGKQPLTVGYFDVRSMHRKVRGFFRENAVQAAVAHSSTMAQYVPATMRQHAIMDMTDVDSQKFADYARSTRFPRAFLYGIEGKRLRRYELEALRDFGCTTLVTEHERELLSRDATPSEAQRIVVINNGVDLEYFRPAKQLASTEALRTALPERERSHFRVGAHRIVFTGAMDYRPNVEGAVHFANKVLPLIRQYDGDAEFLIVGSQPAAQVRALAALPGVRVTGFVQDVRPYLHGSDVCVVPLQYARGVQNKMLEAMAAGCAIVTTPAAVAGVGAIDGHSVVIAHDAHAFAAAALDFIRDRVRRTKFGEKAREHVERVFSWTPLMDRFVALVEAHAAHQQPTSQPAGAAAFDVSQAFKA